MKKMILVLIALLNFSNALACECDGDGPLNPEESIVNLLKIRLGNDITILTNSSGDLLKEIKAYPTLYDRIALIEMRGSSCHIKGPNGEDLAMCVPKAVSDFEVIIAKKDASICRAVVNAKSTLRKVKVKLQSTDC